VIALTVCRLALAGAIEFSLRYPQESTNRHGEVQDHLFENRAPLSYQQAICLVAALRSALHRVYGDQYRQSSLHRLVPGVHVGLGTIAV
jgi:hypothetical protein